MEGSLWLDDRGAVRRPALGGDHRAEVLVLGGGIVGATCAYLLARDGVDVVLAEADAIGAGTTGHTTAKASAGQGLRYAEIERRHDAETARAYARLSTDGIALIEWIAREEAIECDWRRLSHVTYSVDADGADDYRAELAATRRAGLDCDLRDDAGLPFAAPNAIEVRNQADLHPVKWTRAVVDAAQRRGARVFEGSRALALSTRGGSAEVSFAGATVSARIVVVATHFPVFDRGLFFAKLSPQRSYCLAARVRGELPAAMYISSDEPTRSLRTARHGDEELLIVGGEGHKAGQEGDTEARYAALERWTREHFDVDSIAFRWSAQDPVSPDLLPYVGPLTRHTPEVLVATGFSKWGIAAGAQSARLLCDRIAGRQGADADRFDSKRVDPVAAGPTLIRENLNVAAHLLGDRLALVGALEDVEPGHGAIVRDGVERVAAYRDERGRAFLHSATCTHLGCEVRFNAAETSWDCPCHGSRFDARDGRVLEGPAVEPLEHRVPAG